MRSTATVLSYILHPLLMPTFFFLVIFFVIPSPLVNQLNDYQRWLLVGQIFGTTYMVPGVVILYLKSVGVIKDLNAPEQKERIWPAILTSLCFMGSSVLLRITLERIPELFFVMTIITITVVLVTIISLYWKISAHAVGIGGLIGMVMRFSILNMGELYIWPLIVMFLLAGIVMSARIYLGVHRPAEVYIGFLMGAVVSFGAALFFIS